MLEGVQDKWKTGRNKNPFLLMLPFITFKAKAEPDNSIYHFLNAFADKFCIFEWWIECENPSPLFLNTETKCANNLL